MFCGWLYGRDPVMKDPYAHYNEMFHRAGIPAPLPEFGPVDLSQRMSTREKQLRIKAQRVRSFEIACTLVAGEMFAAKGLMG